MKLTQELGFVSKMIGNGICPTNFKVGTTKFFKGGGIIYSNLIFKQDLTWILLKEAYNLTHDIEDPKIKTSIDIINSISTWTEIEIEDINSFDAIGNIAGIEGFDYGIYVSELNRIIKLIGEEKIIIKISKDGMIAFCNEKDEIFLVTGLLSLQKSLF